jgi:heat-inducible transcriptional repressor
MEQLSPRQESILGLIIRDYIEQGSPVGSQALVTEFRLGISSATVRNEMVALTEKGYLRQPHTSAGREPTEAGYRYFVQRLLGEVELPMAEKRMISHQFYQARQDMDQWLRLSASILARHARGASLVTSPRPQQARFKHLELISTHGRMVLLVLVLGGGDVRQQVLNLAEMLTQPDLTESANRINAVCQGQDSEGVVTQAANLSPFEQEVARLVAEAMRKTELFSVGEVFRDGMTNGLAELDTTTSESARQAMRVLEERPYLEEFMTKVLSSHVGGIQVVIGGDEWRELKDCSMVVARYGVVGQVSGAMGVLGPQRMAYGRVISTVRYVAGLLSDMMYEIYCE